METLQEQIEEAQDAADACFERKRMHQRFERQFRDQAYATKNPKDYEKFMLAAAEQAERAESEGKAEWQWLLKLADLTLQERVGNVEAKAAFNAMTGYGSSSFEANFMNSRRSEG